MRWACILDYDHFSEAHFLGFTNENGSVRACAIHSEFGHMLVQTDCKNVIRRTQMSQSTRESCWHLSINVPVLDGCIYVCVSQTSRLSASVIKSAVCSDMFVKQYVNDSNARNVCLFYFICINTISIPHENYIIFQSENQITLARFWCFFFAFNFLCVAVLLSW